MITVVNNILYSIIIYYIITNYLNMIKYRNSNKKQIYYLLTQTENHDWCNFREMIRQGRLKYQTMKLYYLLDWFDSNSSF